MRKKPRRRGCEKGGASVFRGRIVWLAPRPGFRMLRGAGRLDGDAHPVGSAHSPDRSSLMKRIRVLFIIHTLESGGAEGQLVEWLQALPPGEFDRRVVCLVKGGFHEKAVRDLGIPIEILGYRPMRRPDGSLDVGAALTGIPALWRLVRILRHFRPHVVHTLLLMSDVLGALALPLSRVRGIRLVGSRLALTDCARIGRFRQRVLRWSIDRTDVLFCNSRAVAEDAIRTQGADPEKIATIYNGVDWPRFQVAPEVRETTRSSLGLGRGDQAIGCVAQLRPEKDHPSLFRAFAALNQSFPGLRLFLVGGGNREPALRALAKQLGIEDRVVFLGVRGDIPEGLSAFDLAVLPSRTEGFSNVLLETMAAGLPIVATRVGGNSEALDEGRCGILVAPNDPDALAEGIRTLLRNPEEARRLGEAARVRARDHFSLETLHGNLRRFYKELVSRP